MTRREPPCDPQNESPEDIDQRVCGYIDRINLGESIDPVEVLAENPIDGSEILERLERFVESSGIARTPEPLGTLGDYTLRRQIGRGGMGVVYEAWQNSLERQVALKVLPPGVAADAKRSTRFLREAQIAAKLSHPQIVPVFATGIESGTPWYAMEFVEGQTLAQVLEKLKAAEPEGETPFGKKDDVRYFATLADAFAAVADGLQHAHSKGIIHRDIKPSNLILDREGSVRILDFGLARLEGQESLTLSGDFVGTPLYMSPEQARRQKIPIDLRTDIYSLGAALYEMLTGRPPFQGGNHGDTLNQIIECDPTELRKIDSHVPRDLETIVLKCLRKDPKARYDTAAALSQDLRRFVRGEAIEARPQPRWERSLRKAWRKRFPIAGSLVLATVAALVGWQFIGWQRDKASMPGFFQGVWSGKVVQKDPAGFLYFVCILGGKQGDLVGTNTQHGIDRFDPPYWAIGYYKLTVVASDGEIRLEEIITEGNPKIISGLADFTKADDLFDYSGSWLPPGSGKFTRLSSATGNDLPALFRGIWEGSLSNGAHSRRIRLALACGEMGGVVGIADHPDDGCGGLVTLAEVDERSIQLTESIINDLSRTEPTRYGSCGWTNGSLTVKLIDPSTIECRFDNGVNDAPVGDLTNSWVFAMRPRAVIDLGKPDATGKVQAKAGGSTTPAGTKSMTFSWDFGDGSKADGKTVEHVYSPGSYILKLTVTNGVGITADATTTVTVSCGSSEASPWTAADIGVPAIPGKAHLESSGSGSCLALCAGGNGVTGKADEALFAYQEVQGDFVLTARLDRLAGGTPSSQVGLMVRESLDAGSIGASALFRNSSTLPVYKVVRKTPDATAVTATLSGTGKWLRLERKEGAIVASRSEDGENWISVDPPLLKRAPEKLLPEKLFVGLVAAARPPTTGSYKALEARFCDVELHVESGAPR